MTLKVVGAGVGRTGTHSLKVALEQLLGGPCHHMVEMFSQLDTIPTWQRAAEGEAVDWHALLEGYEAIVDWPGGAFWQELSEAYPDAVVLLSTRADAETWWRSADRTVFEAMRATPPPEMAEWHAWILDLMHRRFTDRLDDKDALIAAYERHIAAVRATVPAERLVEWQPTDGWGPLCGALGVEEPDEPFPVTNTTAEFRAMMGKD
jgi:hypothetical protein